MVKHTLVITAHKTMLVTGLQNASSVIIINSLVLTVYVYEQYEVTAFYKSPITQHTW